MSRSCQILKHNSRLIAVFSSLLLAGVTQHASSQAAEWQPVEGRIATRWAEQVTPDRVHAEYPRPSMKRDRWQNLNGLWQYAIRPKQSDCPDKFDGDLLVPFAVESSLSGVGKTVGESNRLWYRRTFSVPESWKNDRTLLHFGAVDWEATVWLNGKEVGRHRGGYDSFSFDITDALKSEGPQECVVAVWDPTDEGTQPRGKQVRQPRGIWYTSVTGIWQTVWLEPVNASSISHLKTTPDLDASTLTVEVEATGKLAGQRIDVEVRDGAETIGSGQTEPGQPLTIAMSSVKPWTPDAPFLYDVKISLRGPDDAVLDEVDSYAGMRKIALAEDDDGIQRMMLNNKFVFQLGPLDQGWWPDGLYTAPCDAALRYDVEVTKKLGFNMLRKHVKIEPERFYYWCDKLGVLVWQDMPSGDRYIRGQDPDLQRTPESATQFELELKRMIDAFHNHPSIVMWVPFNEGWGQYDTSRIVEWIKNYDPTRLVNNASGWSDRGVGDVNDIHRYPGPDMPKPEPKRAIVLGEFGGLGLPVKGHTWQDEKNWGYRSYTDSASLTVAYVDLVDKLLPLAAQGLSAAVYTQTSDVEIEVNGLLTYDRAVIKMDSNLVGHANRRLYAPLPRLKTVVPTSQIDAQTWHYTTEEPPRGWRQPDFDDSAWQTGKGGFGTEGTPGAVIGTAWSTSDIWLRRTFEVQDKPANLYLKLHHDEDVQVFLNGRSAAELEGYVSDYQLVPLSNEALRRLQTGTNTLAVHCRQTRGGQYVDVGLIDQREVPKLTARGPVESPTTSLRPPAVPLVVCDPYFSIWSNTDRLMDSWTTHWTGETHALSGMIRVDGTTYRFLGQPAKETDGVVEAEQLSVDVQPTRTTYCFLAGQVELCLSFITPMLPDDLDVLSRPVTYVRYGVHARDKALHEVSLYFDATAEVAVDKPDQQVKWGRMVVPGEHPLVAMRVGTEAQPVLEKDGDNLRIDWGHFYVAVPDVRGMSTVISDDKSAREAFALGQSLPPEDDQRMPRAVNDQWPVLACVFELGQVGSTRQARHLILAYDDEYSIEFLGQKLRPYWRRDGAQARDLLQQSAEQYIDLKNRCVEFDHRLMADLKEVGGPAYAQLCALAYRQAIAAHKLAAGPNNELMMFSKECFSNGCIATVDVAYPASPIFMLLSNELLKATVRPVLDYAVTERWTFPFAPHDLGRYPKANGQRYGGGEQSEENQMPVEESGNMLLMMAVISKNDGNVKFARQYWSLLERWAGYLKQKGLDPENQLCTDDFAGHLAHNVNLSLKAIEALGAFAMMAEMAGEKEVAAEYRQTAERFAEQWVRMADDGDHFRLTFDRPNTWSQKYNLVWDSLLGLNLFPPSVAEKEIAYYKSRLNHFGLPLDNRSLYTKTDWQVWTATLATSRSDFDILMEPVYAFVNHTPQRVPLTDWYWTHNSGRVGFQARPVIGGVFIRVLADADKWRKWVGKAGE